MKNKDKNSTPKKKKLTLKRETIRTLKSDEMKQAAGGVGGASDQGNCCTMHCTLEGGWNHNQTFLRRAR